MYSNIRCEKDQIFSLKNIKKIHWNYLIIVTAVIISYCVYIPKHYGLDSWNVQKMYQNFDLMQDNHFNAVMDEAIFSCFSAGRFMRGIVFLCFALPRHACLLMQPWVNVVAIIFMCLSGCKLWKLVEQCSRGTNTKILFGCCVLAICNPFFTDWMQFTECQLYHPLALWLAITAAEKAMHSSFSSLRCWCSASALLIMSAGFYQVAMQFYAVMIVILLGDYLHTSSLNLKKLLWKIVFAISIYGVAAFVQLILTNIIFQSDRIQSYDLSYAIHELFSAQKNLFRMTSYTQNPLSMLFPIFIIILSVKCILCIFSLKEKRTVHFILSMVRFLGFYIAIFLPFIISLWFPQRSLVGFWCMPLILAVIINDIEYFERNTSISYAIDTGISIIMSILILSNVYSCICFGVDLYKVNAIDAMRAQWMSNAIDDYEEASGSIIDQIAFYQPEDKKYEYPQIVKCYENNQVAWSAVWNHMAILELISNRDFTQIDYPMTQYQQLQSQYADKLKQRDFITFKYNTAYIALY